NTPTNTPTGTPQPTSTPTNTPTNTPTDTPVYIAQGPSPTRIVLPDAGVDFPTKGLMIFGSIVSLLGLLILL
ncbi:hypothetical protein KKA02_01885, partial [Patescibacteria group bacterium]|nr:hypothetical protein [Patescibacteria group bacterium]